MGIFSVRLPSIFRYTFPNFISIRKCNSAVHEKIDKDNTTEDQVEITKETILKLEKVSFVDFGNEDGIRILKEAIQFADKLKEIHLDDSVKPMYTVLENEQLELREDIVNEGNCRKEILRNAARVEDKYFVAPASNAPKPS